jgi:hypothetical protein
MDELTRENGATFVLIPLPQAYQVYLEDLNNHIKASKLDKDSLDILKYQNILKNYSEENNIVYIDPYQYFIDNKDTKYIYFEHDKHMSVYGHRLMAEFITSELVKMEKNKNK